VRSATSKRGSHLGLGLAVSRASLALFDGTIEARNAPTGGAVFEVTLVAAPPRAEPSVPPPPAPAASPPPPTEQVRSPRILAVDDDLDVVELIRLILEPLGYRITTATSSTQALDAAATESFDLVLCDLGMPKHSGLDVCRLLREAGYGGKLVLMTGWDSHSLIHDVRALDCDALLKKPFVTVDLMQVIHAMLAS
jgi:two-component system capsular synthesis sensor histidine kinase RcsC